MAGLCWPAPNRPDARGRHGGRWVTLEIVIGGLLGALLLPGAARAAEVMRPSGGFARWAWKSKEKEQSQRMSGI